MTTVTVKRPPTDVSPKVVAVAVVTVLAVVVQWIVTGELNQPELASGLTGLISAVLAYTTTDTREV